MKAINENNFKEYFNLKNNSSFLYKDFYKSKKINDKFFVSINVRNKFIIFDVYKNIASLGESTCEFDTIEEVMKYINNLKNNKRANYYSR